MSKATTLRVCEFEGCDRPKYARSLCSGHYSQKLNGTVLRPIRSRVTSRTVAQGCKFPGCERPHRSKGLCNGHYQQDKSGKVLSPLKRAPWEPRPECRYETCTKPSRSNGLCDGHDQQKRSGRTLAPLFTPSPPAPCKAKGCVRRAAVKSLCHNHYALSRYHDLTAAGICTYRIGGCDNQALRGRTKCKEHLERERSQRRLAFIKNWTARRIPEACWMCGIAVSDNFHRDHLIPVSLGGPDEFWNFLPACPHCNISRKNAPLAETVGARLGGFLPDGPVGDALAYALSQENQNQSPRNCLR